MAQVKQVWSISDLNQGLPAFDEKLLRKVRSLHMYYSATHIAEMLFGKGAGLDLVLKYIAEVWRRKEETLKRQEEARRLRRRK